MPVFKPRPILLGALLCGSPVLAGGASPASVTSSPALVSFPAADGLSLWANYGPGPSGAPIILLFHMAASNKAEYREIAPRLNRLGYATLAVDARNGQDTYAGDYPNLTAAAYRKKTGNTAGFDETYPDLEAALRWARHKQPKSKVYVLGSSYSADLVFRLAAEHPADVQAVMSFSPGAWDSTLSAAHKVKVPVFLTSAGNGAEVESAKRVLDAVASPVKTQYVPKSGPHGADALNTLGNSAAADYWQALTAFLSRLK